MSAPVPRLASRSARDSLRALLDGAGYREDRVCALLGASSLAEALSTVPLVLERRTGGGSRLEVLVRLFLLGFELPRLELAAALGEAPVEAMEEACLVEPAPAGLRSTVQLSPVGSLAFASDRHDRHREKPSDFVVGPAPVSRLLADLNGVDNLETAEGDLFAPVVGQRFDLIVCNPPFVISPGSTFLYRDGGSQVCERIVREAPAYLTDGGSLEMLCNWPEAGQDWRAVVARWFEGSSCDGWVLRHHSLAAPAYAAVWLAQEFNEGPIPAEAFAAWTSHLEALGVESVGAGLVVMRPARGRKPWLEIRHAPPITPGAAGDSIARTLAARELRARLGSEEELLEARLRPSPDLEKVARERPVGDGWDGVGLELRLTRGLRFSARVDPVAAALVGLFDGSRTVREAVSVLADHHGVPPELFLEDAPRAIGRLLHLGLVMPAEES